MHTSPSSSQAKATICIELLTIWLSLQLCLQVGHMGCILDIEEQAQGVAYSHAVEKVSPWALKLFFQAFRKKLDDFISYNIFERLSGFAFFKTTKLDHCVPKHIF